MTRSHPPKNGLDVAPDHQPPPSATPADPGQRDAERSRLADDLAWLVHRWIRLGAPRRDVGEPRDPSDIPPRS